VKDNITAIAIQCQSCLHQI